MIRLALLALPLLEIAGFILVGREIGVVATLGLVLLGVVIGSALIRSVGLSVLGQARTQADTGRDPGPRIVRGFLHVVAGILFIVPGFVSDILALVLLLPPLHRRAWALIAPRLRFAGAPFAGAAKPAPRAPVIELERTDYVRRPDAASPNPHSPNPHSPWAKEPDTRG